MSANAYTPAFGGGWLAVSNFCIGAGSRLLRVTRTGQPGTLYAYDELGNLAATALDVDGDGQIDYAGDDRISATATNGTVIFRVLTRDCYRRGLVTLITNWINGTPFTPLNYTHDALDRITARNSDTFGYNSRSEIISADIQSTASRYAYDGIGNNLWTSCNATTNTYTANALNQYAAIDATTLAYDGDGNLLTNGLWSYTWDCDNRLTAVFSNSVCIVSNAYDHAHRRVLKVTPATTCTYLYDGWNLIQETVQTSQSTITNQFVWGRDLAGSLQGAGGIGGLLAVQMGGAWYFPFYDNNGNVIAYADESGAIVAEYTYDAFGRTITHSGELADVFAHRFSTKYFDPETGLYYYGYRYYSPELMCWLCRDPIGELGFEKVSHRYHTVAEQQREAEAELYRNLIAIDPSLINELGLSSVRPEPHLYQFAYNSTIAYIDPFGLSCFTDCWRKCIKDNYGKSIDVALGLSYLAPVSLISSVYAGVVEIGAKEALKNLTLNGAFTSGDITKKMNAAQKAASAAKSLSAWTKVLSILSKASGIVSAGGTGYVFGASAYCTGQCL